MAPTIALIGATGLVGGHLLTSFLDAIASGKVSGLHLLTTGPVEAPRLALAAAKSGVVVHKVDYEDVGTLETALSGIDIVVSAMGMGSNSSVESYEASKANLITAAARSGVKIYVPSEWGTDHQTDAARAIGSPMFEAKKTHHAKAEALGLGVIAAYTGLLLEISFSAWLGIDSSTKTPTWSIPTPSKPVAFTSFADLGGFILSATLQVFHGATDIPSRIRIYSDLISIDDAATEWEQATGGTITREYLDETALAAKYDAMKPTLAVGMLGPAIPLLISQGAFDHGQDNANPVLLRGEWAFKTKTVQQHFESLPAIK